MYHILRSMEVHDSDLFDEVLETWFIFQGNPENLREVMSNYKDFLTEDKNRIKRFGDN